MTGGGSCQGIFCQAFLGSSFAPGADVTVQINVTVAGTPSTSGLVNLLTSITLATDNFSTSDKSATLKTSIHSCVAELNGTTYSTVQAAVDAATAGDTVRVSGACGDMHTNGGPGQLLTLDKDITVQGGWNSTFTTRDTSATPSYLDAGGRGRVVYINGAVSPTLDGLVLRNGSAARLGGGPSGKDAGGGLYINGAAPTLLQMEITTNSSPDIGGGVYVNSSLTPQFTGGGIRSNTASEAGGGLYVYQSAPVLTGVTVSGNTARGGGGIYLNQSAAQLIDPTPRDIAPTCRIETNTASGFPRYGSPRGCGHIARAVAGTGRRRRHRPRPQRRDRGRLRDQRQQCAGRRRYLCPRQRGGHPKFAHHRQPRHRGHADRSGRRQGRRRRRRAAGQPRPDRAGLPRQSVGQQRRQPRAARCWRAWAMATTSACRT